MFEPTGGGAVSLSDAFGVRAGSEAVGSGFDEEGVPDARRDSREGDARLVPAFQGEADRGVEGAEDVR